MMYAQEQAVPANVLEHADTVFTNAILLSAQVRALVDHLCGTLPEPVGSKPETGYGSAFSHLRTRAGDALTSIEVARDALRRLESEVGYSADLSKSSTQRSYVG